MRFMTLTLVAITVILAGCFDSNPPTGVTGELVGCITSGDDLYCTTKYADRGVSDTVDVLIGKIDFESTRASTVRDFHLRTSYTDEDGDRDYYTIFVKSLRTENIVGYKDRATFTGTYIRILSGDTVAVAIVNPPTVQTPHTGYIIANLTRPEASFVIPEEVGDIDVIDLIEP